MKKTLLILILFMTIATPCCAIQSKSSAFGLSDGEKMKVYDKHEVISGILSTKWKYDQAV